jgi:hypothetical protein
VISVRHDENLKKKYRIDLVEKVPIGQKFEEAFKDDESLKFLFE